jgi:hypothetical protein
MKYLFLIATVFLQFLLVLTLKLLDSFDVIIAIFILCLGIGAFINFSKKKSKNGTVNPVGWGLFYGSLASLGLVIVFTIWLSFNFPG